MTDWEINIPYRDRDDLVLDAITAARDSQLPEHEVQVVDVLARDALERGITTIGGLIDELGQFDRPETRRRLDWAREQAGLLTATESDRRRKDVAFENALARISPPGPARWSPLQRCPQCGRYPLKDGGGWAQVEINQWWCDEHKHLAKPDDFQPYEAPYRIGPSGGLVPSAREKARLAKWAEDRREEEERERRQREERRTAEGAALDQVRQRYAETAKISVAGIQITPQNVHVHPERDR